MSFLAKLTSTIGQLFTTTVPAVVEAARQQELHDILWRERAHTNDPEYKQHLNQLLTAVSVTWETRLGVRPLAMEVEQALHEAGAAWPVAQKLWADPLRQLTQKQQNPTPPDELIADLQSEDWLVRFVARHTLVYLGGEAAPLLAALAGNSQSALHPTADWLLRSIEAETTLRLWPRAARLLCPRCLVHCYNHWINVPGPLPLGYYGCRACGQSREFLDWPGQIITVLDNAMTESYVEQNGVIRGNWLSHRALFDTDWVEIIQATDEDVERFAVQVGNDTDELRQPRYPQMRCLVAPQCQLSENTWRILQHTFGQVERESPHE